MSDLFFGMMQSSIAADGELLDIENEMMSSNKFIFCRRIFFDGEWFN